MVVLAGAIGERGTRYKTLDHKFYLTDLYNSFDVIPNKPISMTAAQLTQLLGRLCSMLAVDTNVFVTPTLWTPSRCWSIGKVFLSYSHELPIFNSLMLENETYDNAVIRLLSCDSPHASLLPSMKTIYATTNGANKKGKSIYLDPIPNKSKSRVIQDTLAEANGDSPPPQLDLDYNQDEIDREHMQAALREVEEKGIDKALADAFPSAPNAVASPPCSLPKVSDKMRGKRKAAASPDDAPIAARGRTTNPTAIEQHIDSFFPEWKSVKLLFKKVMHAKGAAKGTGKGYAKDMVCRAQYCVLAVVEQKEKGLLPNITEVDHIFALSDNFLKSILNRGDDSIKAALDGKNNFVSFRAP